MITYDECHVYFQHWPPEQHPGQVVGQRKGHKDIDPDRPWLSSVYYYWWRFLSASKEYRTICEKAETVEGRNSVEVIESAYPDFGNVFEGNFWSWWWQRGWALFCEPMSYSIRKLARTYGTELPYEWDENERLILSVARNGDHQRTADEVKALLDGLESANPKSKSNRGKKVSGALYQPQGRPDVPALERSFAVWNLYRANSNLPTGESKLKVYDIAYKCGLQKFYMPDDADWRREASDNAFRALKRAEIIISNVTRGVFFTKHELMPDIVRYIKDKQMKLSHKRREEIERRIYDNPFADLAIGWHGEQHVDASLAQLDP